MNNEELARLKALALAATPGPWERETIRSDGEYGGDDDGGSGFDTYQITDNKGLCIMDCLNNDVGAVEVGHDGDAWDKVAKCDATYVSAASPDVVLALIERIEAMTVDAERLDWLDQNIFSTDMDRLDRQLHPNQWAWRTFAPENVQGSARNIISAAMAGEKK